MDRRRVPGHPDIEVVLKRTARARRFSLRVSHLGGGVSLTMPARAREADAMAFARDKADWIRAAMARAPGRLAVAPGGTVYFEGRPVPILLGTGRGVRFDAGALVVPEGRAGGAGRALQGYMKVLARARLAFAADRYAGALGRGYRSLSLRDTRSRWGSCTAEGGLMFSWRLVMAPPEVLDYVAAHEVAHLAEMNHSPAFWAVVARLYGDHRRERAWLRAHGGLLQRYDFSDSGAD